MMLTAWNRVMKKDKVFLFIFLLSSFVFAECNPNKIVVLVPGTLNSAVPGTPGSSPHNRVYFSQAIIDTVTKFVCHTYVVKGLTWFGDFKTNGGTVFKELIDWQEQHPVLRGLPIEIIAHSAGGFYSLQAASLNYSLGSPLNFTRMHFLSTPLKGLELANILSSNNLVRRQMEKLFNRNYAGLDLRGLWQLRSPQTQAFLDDLVVPNDIEVNAYAGIQTPPPSLDREFESAFLPPVFQAFEFLMDRLGDGIVSAESALGQPLIHSTNGNLFLNLHPHPEAEIPLDHVEEVWDFKYLEYLGFQETSHVEAEQIKFIESLKL